MKEAAHRKVRGWIIAMLIAVLALWGLGLLGARTVDAQATPVPEVNLTYICTLPADQGGGGVFFRISNPQNVPDLTITTTRGTGPRNVAALRGQSFFKGAAVTTAVRFSAPGYSDVTVTKAAGNLLCRANLNLNKVVEGPGPAAPYRVEVREGTSVIQTVQLTAGQDSATSLPAGFVTNDYPGYTYNFTRDYTVEEVGTQGADRISYDPGRDFSLSYGNPKTITITNTFSRPITGANLTYICTLPENQGGGVIWRITNPDTVPDLRFTTVRGTGPQDVAALPAQSFFKGSDETTVVRFSAPGYEDRTVTKAAGDLPCEADLNLNKVVEGDGPDGPYEVEISEGSDVVDTVEVSTANPTEVTLPAGFVTDDYPGYESITSVDYTVEETSTQGADRVAYDPGQDVSLVYGSPKSITITNTFLPPVTGVDLSYVCGLGGGAAIWQIDNTEDRSGLRATTTVGTGPQNAPVPDGASTFKGANETTAVRFNAPGFSPVTEREEPGDRRCEGTLRLNKVVEGDGPDGPYSVEISEGSNLVDTVEVSTANPTEVTLPAGFETDDYPGFESGTRVPYTVEEVGRRGADRVSYDPRQDFSLSDGDSRSVTITNTFLKPITEANLTYICTLPAEQGGGVIWRITNGGTVPGLRFTTTLGVGPRDVAALPNQSFFKGANALTEVTFNADGYKDLSVRKAVGSLTCSGTLRLDKIVQGLGPSGPYSVEISNDSGVVSTVELNDGQSKNSTLPAGFSTDDYPGYTVNETTDYTVEEVETQGAIRTTYDPGQDFTLAYADSKSITVTNTFVPVPDVDLTYVCGLGDGAAIWKITNPRDVPGLDFTTQGTGPRDVAALPGDSTFKGSDAATTVRFSAPSYNDRTVTTTAGDNRCEGTLRLNKVVEGDGPDGPYSVEVRESAAVVDTVRLTAGQGSGPIVLPAGFETDDYLGYESGTRGPYTVEEIGRRGADRVTYDPGQDFSLSDGDRKRITITNAFDPPVPGAGLAYVCGLGEGEAIWKITNAQDVPGLTATTTQGVGPRNASVPGGVSTFRGADEITSVRFNAAGYAPKTAEGDPGEKRCQGTLRVKKVVEGPGPAGPYTIAIRSVGEPERRVNIGASGPVTATLPAGFETDDYRNYGSQAKNYTIEEVNQRGAARVEYRPGRSFSLVDRQAVEATIVNYFGPECADLAVKVRAPQKVLLGKTFAYTITARNLGPADVRDAVLTSRLPGSVEFVRAGQDCRYDRASGKVTCDLGGLAAGASKQRKIWVKAQKAGTVRLQGCAVKSGTPDCEPSNDTLGSADARSEAPGRAPRRAPTETRDAPGVGPVTEVLSSKQANSSAWRLLRAREL